MNSVFNTFKFPCACCAKPVKSINQKGLKCTNCKQWLHISCAGISTRIYDDLSDKFENWQCNICIFNRLPFHLVENDVESNSYDNPPSSFTPDTARSRSNLVYTELNGKGLKIAQLKC